MNGVTYIGPWGGGGGDPFDLYRSVGPLPANYVLDTPLVRSGSWLDAMIAVYWDKDHTQNRIYSPLTGGDGGGWSIQSSSLRVGEYIVGASGRTGNYVDHLYLFTNFGLNFNVGGGGGSADFRFRVDEPEEEIIGFFGRAHTYLDAIGFIVRKRQ